MAEADYLVMTRLGVAAARDFSADVAAGAYTLASWSARDHAAAAQVSAGYHDYVGITDAANVVLPARHFRMLRPMTGGDAFSLLPDDLPD